MLRRDSEEAESHMGDIAKKKESTRQAILIDACTSVGRHLSNVETGLEKIEKANNANNAMLVNAESRLSMVEAVLEQVRHGRGRGRERQQANKVSIVMEPLPP